MMRRQKPEEMSALTDLIVEEIEIGDAGHRLRRGQPIRRASQPARAPHLQHRQWLLHAIAPLRCCPPAAAVSGGLAGVVSATRAGFVTGVARFGVVHANRDAAEHDDWRLCPRSSSTRC